MFLVAQVIMFSLDFTLYFLPVVLLQKLYYVLAGFTSSFATFTDYSMGVHVWFTLSDSPVRLSLIVNHTHCTLSRKHVVL